MGLLGKILTVIACAIGIVCCCFALGENKYVFEKGAILSSNTKGYIACTFIALFVFIGAAVLIFCTFCCPCTDIIGGIVGVVAGVVTAVFMSIAYACFYHSGRFGGITSTPRVGEWLFGGIVSGIELVLIALTLAVG